MRPHTPATDARVDQVRQWIAHADCEGLLRADLQLHLSHRDLSGLKRSPSVSTDEISFLNGVMRFLGVEVVDAAASASRLDQRAAAVDADPELVGAPATTPKKRTRKAQLTAALV
jgi:hypothetical protein